jgi:hypothetical protein
MANYQSPSKILFRNAYVKVHIMLTHFLLVPIMAMLLLIQATDGKQYFSQNAVQSIQRSEVVARIGKTLSP